MNYIVLHSYYFSFGAWTFYLFYSQIILKEQAFVTYAGCYDFDDTRRANALFLSHIKISHILFFIYTYTEWNVTVNLSSFLSL